jgi:hypothetical protein
MGKLINRSLEPPESPESEDHVEIEDIARLAEGTVDDVEKEHFFRHINRCQKCYRILHHTLQDASYTASGGAAGSRWKTKTLFALAAAIILIIIIGGQLIHRNWRPNPAVISATLDLDQNLKDILLEDDALQFGQGARLDRLLAAIQEKGIAVRKLKRVVLSKPYYQKKSLFGPEEVLHIRIENDVAYLEVKEKRTD